MAQRVNAENIEENVTMEIPEQSVMTGEEFVNGKISAADVWCSGKILLRTDIGCGSFQNFQCFHYALCGKET